MFSQRLLLHSICLGYLLSRCFEDVQLVLASGLLISITHDDDVFEGITSPVVVESKHVDPPLSFDVLLGFVSRSDDVLTLSSYMDMSLFEYFPVSYDITLSSLHLPTPQIFDIDDEIVQQIFLLLIQVPVIREFHLPEETLRLLILVQQTNLGS